MQVIFALRVVHSTYSLLSHLHSFDVAWRLNFLALFSRLTISVNVQCCVTLFILQPWSR